MYVEGGSLQKLLSQLQAVITCSVTTGVAVLMVVIVCIFKRSNGYIQVSNDDGVQSDDDDTARIERDVAREEQEKREHGVYPILMVIAQSFHNLWYRPGCRSCQ